MIPRPSGKFEFHPTSHDFGTWLLQSFESIINRALKLSIHLRRQFLSGTQNLRTIKAANPTVPINPLPRISSLVLPISHSDLTYPKTLRSSSPSYRSRLIPSFHISQTHQPAKTMIIIHAHIIFVCAPIKELLHFLALHDTLIGDSIVEHQVYSLPFQHLPIIAKERCEEFDEIGS